RSKLTTLLKKLTGRYKPKKSNIFEQHDVIRFLKQASDNDYLFMKCTIKPVGINTFYKIPENIASFLKLANSEVHTGHCFRRSAVTMLSNSRADLTTIKRMGG
ncbi:Phage integrase domain containing protein, partial [Asbolus verrucosus]